jgi:hypothetical protein
MKRCNLICVAAILAAVTSCATSSATTQTSPVVQAPASLPPAGYRPEFGTMWTFDAPPLEYWRKTYGFSPDKAWLDHVRSASVRLSNCSSSFVSANGLVMTNQHCVRDCAVDVSPPDTNYIQAGFIARSLREEKKCPGMYIDELVSIDNVTDRVRGALTGATPQAQAMQRSQVISLIETECGAQTGLTCQVVSLYHGGIYSIYRYKRYDDLRLVFSPEDPVAAFGGDYDNFTYPRQDFDIGFLRAYVADKPFTPKDYLRWSANGPAEDELVFVVGNPGSTGRLNTMAQMAFLRDVGYPTTLASYARALDIYRELSKKSEANLRQYQNNIFGIENAQKATMGYHRGLVDSTYMNRRAAFEAEIRARIAADPKLAPFSSAFDEIAGAQRELATFDAARRFHSFGPALPLAGSRLLTMSGQLVRIQAQTALPDSSRMAAYRGNLAANIRAGLLREQPLDTTLERMAIAAHLRAAQAELPADDPYLKAALAGRTPDEAAAALVRNTHVGELAFRKTLVDGGAAAVASSADPLIVLARTVDPMNRTVLERTARLNAIITANTERIGQSLFAIYGTALPPDATFTLRITDGIVKGYPNNGTFAPYKTTFHGLYNRSASFDGKPPWNLPPRWVERKSRLDLETPADFASTTDIIGGNSGSPVINRRGEVVGVAFDGNIESLPNRFMFLSDLPRTVSVHSKAVPEVLRKVYDAPALADELQSGGPPKPQ